MVIFKLELSSKDPRTIIETVFCLYSSRLWTNFYGRELFFCFNIHTTCWNHFLPGAPSNPLLNIAFNTCQHNIPLRGRKMLILINNLTLLQTEGHYHLFMFTIPLRTRRMLMLLNLYSYAALPWQKEATHKSPKFEKVIF